MSLRAKFLRKTAVRNFLFFSCFISFEKREMTKTFIHTLRKLAFCLPPVKYSEHLQPMKLAENGEEKKPSCFVLSKKFNGFVLFLVEILFNEKSEIDLHITL